MKKKITGVLSVVLLATVLVGCKVTHDKNEKAKDLKASFVKSYEDILQKPNAKFEVSIPKAELSSGSDLGVSANFSLNNTKIVGEAYHNELADEFSFDGKLTFMNQDFQVNVKGKQGKNYLKMDAISNFLKKIGTATEKSNNPQQAQYAELFKQAAEIIEKKSDGKFLDLSDVKSMAESKIDKKSKVSFSSILKDEPAKHFKESGDEIQWTWGTDTLCSMLKNVSGVNFQKKDLLKIAKFVKKAEVKCVLNKKKGTIRQIAEFKFAKDPYSLSFKLNTKLEASDKKTKITLPAPTEIMSMEDFTALGKEIPFFNQSGLGNGDDSAVEADRTQTQENDTNNGGDGQNAYAMGQIHQKGRACGGGWWYE